MTSIEGLTEKKKIKRRFKSIEHKERDRKCKRKDKRHRESFWEVQHVTNNRIFWKKEYRWQRERACGRYWAGSAGLGVTPVLCKPGCLYVFCILCRFPFCPLPPSLFSGLSWARRSQWGKSASMQGTQRCGIRGAENEGPLGEGDSGGAQGRNCSLFTLLRDCLSQARSWRPSVLSKKGKPEFSLTSYLVGREVNFFYTPSIQRALRSVDGPDGNWLEQKLFF